MTGSAKVFPLEGEQLSAVDPRDTVWLSASAGTGKTQVLSARVLRLLLDPAVEPSQILCLTFTRAGAAEMATRVNSVLASWVRASQTDLFRELSNIGADAGPDAIARARTRFAAVLDCPGGGLRIETLHGFAQWLLSAFPMEAGLVPGTRPMEDRTRTLLMREVLGELLTDADERGDRAPVEALAMLSLRTDQSGVERFLETCAAARNAWQGPGAWQPPLLPRVNRLLGLAADHDASHVEALCRDAVFDTRSLDACIAACREAGGKRADGMADAGATWRGLDPAARMAELDGLRSAFLKADGEPKWVDQMSKADPSYPDHAARLATSVARVLHARELGELALWLAPVLTLGREFALRWEDAKRREGLIDFDDQIREAARLLSNTEMSDWIRYKLDRQFDHILIDEAQDTNEAQWDVIEALTAEFFAGEGARGDTLRTLFVVGDYKQAIFGFQGTSPENFESAKLRFARRMAEARANAAEARGGGEMRALASYGLGRSYRSAKPILSFVDRAVEGIGKDQFGLPDPPRPHEGEDRPGQVVLWQVIGQEGEEANDKAPAEGEEDTYFSRPDRQLASRIAAQVRRWIDGGFPLYKGAQYGVPRAAGPGDVMILVRKRKDLAGLIVARLYAAGVPVAGVDRLRLGAPLAVRDLMAALRFAAQPGDDLSLAALLVSPLFGWSQEELLEHGYHEPGVRLWDHLRDRKGERPETAVASLRLLLAKADFDTPQALLHWLLTGPWQGRRKLTARLGREANDPIDELLNAAHAFPATQTASLAGFIRWFDTGDGELKREADQQAGLVRVMTVHGAKGLQAPIVILADAADNPDNSFPSPLALREPQVGHEQPPEIPLPRLRREQRLGPIAEADDAQAKAEREEHWRLLYVAMTRAEEALFIGGALGSREKEPAADSWYARLLPLFEEEWADDPHWGRTLHWGDAPSGTGEGSRDAGQAALPLLPAWAERAVGEEPRPPRPLAPSSLGEDDAPDPPHAYAPDPLAAKRGVLIHRLLERLPELPADERRDRAMRWLERQGGEFDAVAREEMAASAVAVLSDERFRDVFAAGALAEAPIVATVGGRVVAGTIDRLCLGDDGDPIRIVDYKTARRPPRSLDDIPGAYVRQMAAYCAALRVIYPGREIEAALLYTQTPELFVLPADKLDEAVERLEHGE